MKKYLFLVIAGLIFLNVWGAGDVSAQSVKTLQAEVKFDFRVGDKIYPAGVYRLEAVSQNSDNLLRLRGVGKNNHRLIIANLSYAAKKQSPKLIFQQIGEEYYLTNIFMADGNWGFSVRPSRWQRENGKNLASTKSVEVPAKN
jgi:hypothetical protein